MAEGLRGRQAQGPLLNLVKAICLGSGRLQADSQWVLSCRTDTGARGYRGSSPGPQVEEAALELKELQGVQGGMASRQECLQEGTRPSESTLACRVLTYLLLPYPDMLGSSGSGQEGLGEEEQGLWVHKVCGFRDIVRIH